jgi:hypothetical protein
MAPLYLPAVAAIGPESELLIEKANIPATVVADGGGGRRAPESDA